ncbi:PAP2 superfamily protein [compost metagenome]
MHTVSFLGLPVITLSVGATIALWGVTHANTRLWVAGGAIVATIGANAVAKLAFQRERPATGYVEEMLIHSYSFPSGHSAGSMVAYGTLAFLALHSLPGPWGVICATILGFLILSIGISRIYLGAHFASDVIGGWLVGAIGLAIIILFIKPTLA